MMSCVAMRATMFTSQSHMAHHAACKRAAQAPADGPPQTKRHKADGPSSHRCLTDTAFASMPLSNATQKGLAQMQLKYATEVQAACVPTAMAGSDVIGQAKTGTGKTLAFLIPIIEALEWHGPGPGPGPNAIVLTPTRELAMQIQTEFARVAAFHSLTAALIVGGRAKGKDAATLASKPDVLVATPGRLQEHLSEGLLAHDGAAGCVRVLVLDEMDRLLDEGFWPAVEGILRALPPPRKRQTLLFSATVPKSVLDIAARVTRSGQTVVHKMVQESDTNVHQQVGQQVQDWDLSVMVTPVLDQLAVLLALVRCETQRPSHKVMVFFTTARQTQCMAEAFNAAGLPVLEIHSRKTQSHRNRVSEHFRTGSGLVLFSSDVSARGMDYPDVTCVVQVGMPSSQDQYIHRLGRTARGTADAGHAILLLSDFEAAGAASLRSLGVKDVPPPNAAAEAGAVQLCRKALAGDKGVTAVQVYIAFLGYYSTMCKRVGCSPADLVAVANKYIPWLFSLSMPPALEASQVGKMRLKYVPGIRIESGNRRP